LEDRLSSITSAEDTITFASGVGALSALFFSMLTNEDHIIFSNITYIATYRLLNELFNSKFGVETSIVDTTNIKDIESAIRPNTKLIHIETPGNPTISISDISKISKLAHENNILLSVDNTLASPYNQKPLDLGADFSIESLTKYIN
jgi:methionine-gamma-lyase